MSSMTPAQAAQQSNRDDQGRYRELQRSEPETDILMTQDDITQRGTFFFPPQFSTAEEAIDFYERVPIDSDIIYSVVLANGEHREWVAQQIEAQRQDIIQAQLNEFMEHWDSHPDNKPGLFVKEHPDRKRIMQGEMERLQEIPAEEFGLEQPPKGITSFDASTVTRALKLANLRPSPNRFPEESQKVLDHVVQLDDGDYTVQQIKDTYRNDFVLQALAPKSHAADTSQILLQELRSLREEVSGLSQHSQALQQDNAHLRQQMTRLSQDHHEAARLQEMAQGYRDEKGRWITPGRYVGRKIMGKE